MTKAVEFAVWIVCLSLLTAGCAQQAKTPTAPPVGYAGVSELEAQIEQKYESPQAHYELGRIYQSLRNWDKAEFEYNVALRFAPTHAQAKAALVRTIADNGDKARAATVADELIKKSDSLNSCLAFAAELRTRQLDDYAIAAYRHAMTMDPKSPVPPRELGRTYLARKDNKQAEQYLRRSFELDPYQADVAAELGRMGVIIQAPQRKGPFDWLTGLFRPRPKYAPAESAVPPKTTRPAAPPAPAKTTTPKK